MKGKVRNIVHTLGTKEEPLFLAKDVAEWIGHSQPTRIANLVDEEEKLLCTVFTSGQNREMWFLTEDGLYEVLMQSRKQNINDRLYVNSREVAEMIGKRHDHLLRDIKKYCEILSQNEPNPELGTATFFVPATYKDTNNQDRPCYLLTRKGCDMVANKMSGEKGALSSFYFYK